ITRISTLAPSPMCAPTEIDDGPEPNDRDERREPGLTTKSRCGAFTSVASIFPLRGWRQISTDCGSCRSAISTSGRRCGGHTCSGAGDMTREIAPDLIALTGGIVDGSVLRRAHQVAPFEALASDDRAFFVLGNHDYYSGTGAWAAHFEAMGFRVLRN